MVEQNTTPGNKKHILTIVIEDYYQVASFEKLIPKEYWGRFESRLQQNIEASLSLLARHQSTATFFVCGWIAGQYPHLLKNIVEQGHEVACQGYFHHNLESLPRDKLIEDIVRSRAAVQKATGLEVQGFRIAQGWLKESQLWLLESLAELGFLYDSSMCRIGFEYSSEPHRGLIHQEKTTCGEIFEVPVSSQSLMGFSIPIAGGNYWRQFPSWLFRNWIRDWINTSEDSLVSYFHIWELDPQQPKISAANPIQKIRHYRNLDTMADKICHYLEKYDFVSIRESLNLRDSETRMYGEPHDAALRGAKTVEKANPEQSKRALTLVIPCYNEEQTLKYLRNTLERFVEQSTGVLSLQFVFVDDGSQDDTWNSLNKLFPMSESCVLVQHTENQGVARAIMTGFANVNTELVAVIDADCTFSPEQILDMLELLEEDVDVVSASPMHQMGCMQNVSWWRGLMSKGAAWLHRRVMRHKLTSYTSCFRLYRSRVLKGLEIKNNGFCGVTEILARIDIAGHRIVEFPALLEVRLLGASKINVIGTIFEHIRLVALLLSERGKGQRSSKQANS